MLLLILLAVAAGITLLVRSVRRTGPRVDRALQEGLAEIDEARKTASRV
jgi:hypothetical protein